MNPNVLRLNDGTELRMTPGGNVAIVDRDGAAIQLQRADIADVLIWMWHAARSKK